MDGVIIRQYQQSDADAIAEIITRDQFNLQKGTTAQEFDRGLDEPGERIRENTFVALIQKQIIGYISLCFCDTSDNITVYSYSGVDIDWRRRGIGSFLLSIHHKTLEGFFSETGKKDCFCSSC